MARPVKNLEGQVFERWSVVGPYVRYRGWTCKCACGTVRVVDRHTLLKGLSKSCGCAPNLGNYRHGHSRSTSYISWHAMKSRCTNPKNSRYHSHGGRDIKICERWSKFENFLADMGERPAGKSIDREDNDGDYTPKNCRWASPLEQASNTRAAKSITYNGETRTINGWARHLGVHAGSISRRFKKGWSVQDALFGR